MVPGWLRRCGIFSRRRHDACATFHHQTHMILLDDGRPWISRYRMRAKGFLNAVSGRREFEGALIRVGGGYGCIHPWPELGDPPLDKCLADLAGDRRWPLVRRALRCAEYDAAARAHDDSLFEEMEVPRSHATLPAAEIRCVEEAVAAGFEVVKLKCGRDLGRVARTLETMVGAYPALRWRLDFNECADGAEMGDFVAALPGDVRRALDFIEDPCPYAEGVWEGIWRRGRVRLAVDREASPGAVAAQVVVIKPAVDEPFLLAEAALARGQQVVMTSYMDHPLGQAFAAWEAARLGLLFQGVSGVCGLQTHHLFEPDAFTDWLGPWSPVFHPPGGTGLGFDDLLEALPWTRHY